MTKRGIISTRLENARAFSQVPHVRLERMIDCGGLSVDTVCEVMLWYKQRGEDCYARISRSKQAGDFRVRFGYDKDIVAAVREVPGRRWDKETSEWVVPYASAKDLYNFASENLYSLERETGVAPAWFCEGRRAKRADVETGVAFWWCRGLPCYRSGRKLAQPDMVETWTLLDLLAIMGQPVKGPAGAVAREGYELFLANINRLVEIAAHMFCRECDCVLHPSSSSHYAHYRITHFRCANEDCPQRGAKVYVNHCMNGSCMRVIDSRDSQKCPNGLYICKEDDCGCCCSDAMFRRRAKNQELIGIGRNMDRQGHLEEGIAFCWVCGNQMERKLSPRKFVCSGCHVEYERPKRVAKHEKWTRPSVP